MPYKTITSPSNPVIKAAASLRGKAPRRKLREFLVEGPLLVQSALSAGAAFNKAFFTEKFLSNPKGRSLIKRVSASCPETYEVAERVMKKLSDTEAPQGLLAVCTFKALSLRELAPPKDKPWLILASDAIQDPGNLGALIRTADAAGADAAVVLPGSCDPFMPKALRASAGSVFHLPLVFCTRPAFITWARDMGIGLARTSSASGQNIFEADLKGPLAIVFGNEKHGISQELLDASKLVLHVPIFGRAESLNVAASAAVCLYEAARRRL